MIKTLHAYIFLSLIKWIKGTEYFIISQNDPKELIIYYYIAYCLGFQYLNIARYVFVAELNSKNMYLFEYSNIQFKVIIFVQNHKRVSEDFGWRKTCFYYFIIDSRISFSLVTDPKNTIELILKCK